MKTPDLAATFLQEADDLLAEIEIAVLSINAAEANIETVNHIFRAFHTIKGSGSMFGFDQVASFTHHIETLLDKVRDGFVPVTEQLATVILAAADEIKALLIAAQGGKPVDPGLQAVLLETISQLSQPTTPIVSSRKPLVSDPTLPIWGIRFRPELSILATGGNPFLLFRDLKKLGKCVMHGIPTAFPPWTS